MKKLNLNSIKKELNNLSEGYECISEEYINATTPLIFRCPNNHKSLISKQFLYHIAS